MGSDGKVLETKGAEVKLQLVDVRQHLFLRRENTVLAPDIAFYSREAEKRILEPVVDNSRRFLERKPRNVVAPKPEYNLAMCGDRQRYRPLDYQEVALSDSSPTPHFYEEESQQ